MFCGAGPPSLSKHICCLGLCKRSMLQLALSLHWLTLQYQPCHKAFVYHKHSRISHSLPFGPVKDHRSLVVANNSTVQLLGPNLKSLRHPTCKLEVVFYYSLACTNAQDANKRHQMLTACQEANSGSFLIRGATVSSLVHPSKIHLQHCH